METLEQAKQHLRDNWERGTVCPCCTQTVKLYKRRLHAGMIVQLIHLYKKGHGWHHLKDIVNELGLSGGGDFSKLRYWGFIVNKANENPKTKDSGLWQITEKGVRFITGGIANAPKYANVYNGQFMGFSEERTTIRQALGNGFDFDELMNS